MIFRLIRQERDVFVPSNRTKQLGTMAAFCLLVLLFKIRNYHYDRHLLLDVCFIIYPKNFIDSFG